MQHNRQTQCLRRRLAGVVIRCAADTAGHQHRQTFGKAVCQLFHQYLALIRQILHPGQLQTALQQCLFEKGKMLILPIAVEDFVADDDQTK